MPFPGITMWYSDGMPSLTYQILMQDVPISTVTLPENKVLVPQATRDPELARRCEARSPAGGFDPSWWLPVRETADLDEVWSAEEVIAAETIGILRKSAAIFVGIQETQWVLDQLNVDYPGLVTEVQKALSVQRIAEVLRRLLEEDISIRNARGIMESLVTWGGKEKDLLMLTEYVRCDMARYIAWRATAGASSLTAVLLDAELEQHIRQSIKQTPTGNFLALPPEEINVLVQRIRALSENGENGRINGAVLVASMDIRRYVRRMIEVRLNWLPVYSYQELGGLVELRPLGRVSM